MSRDAALLSAFTLVLVGFVIVGILLGFWNQTGGSAVETPASSEIVRLDYMHASWCQYCAGTKEDLETIAFELYPNVELLIWDEANRESDEPTREIYDKYKKEGLFGGYPTIVANEKHTLVGKTEKEEMKSWICTIFENKPDNCIE